MDISTWTHRASISELVKAKVLLAGTNVQNSSQPAVKSGKVLLMN